MRIDEKKTTSPAKPTERRHLRAVPSRPTPPERGPRRAATGTSSDRFSDSGEREEAPSERVGNILGALQQGESRSTSRNGEGITDIAGDLVGDLRDRAGDVAGTVRDTVGDVAGSVRDTAGDIVGGLSDRAGDALGDVGDLFQDIFGGGHGQNDDSLAEERESNATVAVIDYFADEGDEAEHGDIVESILQDNSGLSADEIQRYRAGGGPGIDGLAEASPEEFGEAFDSYIEGRVTGLLDGSSNAIEDILSDENSSIRTINQSLGAPESRIAGDIASRLQSDPAFRERFLDYAGLDENADQREVMQALVDEVGDSRRSNETIQESKARYDRLVRDAYDRGITTTDSSGNYGAFARQLEALGVETDDEFHTDVLNNPLILSVGGTDSNGTGTVSDDEVSGFSSPNAGADIAAQGTAVTTEVDGVEQGGDGTSFAAPQAAAAAAVLAEQYPELTPAQIRTILQKTAVNPGLDSDLVGAGILQQDAALDLAEQLAA